MYVLPYNQVPPYQISGSSINVLPILNDRPNSLLKHVNAENKTKFVTDAQGNEIGKLFVGGLSQATTNNSLLEYFSKFSIVENATVMMDNRTGRSRGFGYVKFERNDILDYVILNGPHVIDGKLVDPKKCNVHLRGRNKRSLKVFVGGITRVHTKEVIFDFFLQFGMVTDVNMQMEEDNLRHKGFAFVGFELEQTVKLVLTNRYYVIHGKRVEVKPMAPSSHEKSNSVSEASTNSHNNSSENILNNIQFLQTLPPSTLNLPQQAVVNMPTQLVPVQQCGLLPSSNYLTPQTRLLNFPNIYNSNITPYLCHTIGNFHLSQSANASYLSMPDFSFSKSCDFV